MSSFRTCPQCHGQVIIGGSCWTCDGQPKIIANEIAQALDALIGPRNRRRVIRTNQYGGKSVVKFNPSQSESASGISNNVTLFAWQSESGLPEAVTIELSYIASSGGGSYPAAKDNQGNKLSYRVQAQVLIGTPGAMFDTFTMDFDQRFTVSASYVAVTAVMLQPPPGYLSGSIAVVAGLGNGESISVAPVIATQYIDNLAPGAAAPAIIIPLRAASLLPLRSSDIFNLMQFVIFDTAGTAIDALQFTNGQMVSPATLSDDAHSMIITNLSGVNAASYRPQFQLSF